MKPNHCETEYQVSNIYTAYQSENVLGESPGPSFLHYIYYTWSKAKT